MGCGMPSFFLVFETGGVGSGNNKVGKKVKETYSVVVNHVKDDSDLAGIRTIVNENKTSNFNKASEERLREKNKSKKRISFCNRIKEEEKENSLDVAFFLIMNSSERYLNPCRKTLHQQWKMEP